jgi:hypothetical protein
MSSGLAFPDSADGPPTPLPVQALDHVAGYLMATAAIRGLIRLRADGAATTSQTSLAAVAALLARRGPQAPGAAGAPVSWAAATREETGWGPGWRLPGPVGIGGISMSWAHPAAPLGSGRPAWS